MVDSTQDKIHFNIKTKLNDLKEREKSEFKSLNDINGCRAYVAEKLNIMNSLKINEEKLDKFEGSVFQKEEIETINRIEELQRSMFAKKRLLLPISIMSVLSFMGFYRQCFSVKTFYENIHLITPVFATTYFIGNTFINLGYKSQFAKFEKNTENTLEKARLHSQCMMLTNQLKYDPDRHLE